LKTTNLSWYSKHESKWKWDFKLSVRVDVKSIINLQEGKFTKPLYPRFAISNAVPGKKKKLTKIKTLRYYVNIISVWTHIADTVEWDYQKMCRTGVVLIHFTWCMRFKQRMSMWYRTIFEMFYVMLMVATLKSTFTVALTFCQK